MLLLNGILFGDERIFWCSWAFAGKSERDEQTCKSRDREMNVSISVAFSYLTVSIRLSDSSEKMNFKKHEAMKVRPVKNDGLEFVFLVF